MRAFATGVLTLALVAVLVLAACVGEESFLNEAKGKCDAHGGVFQVTETNLGQRYVECNDVRRDLPGSPRWAFAVRESGS